MHDVHTYSCILDIRHIILERYNGRKELGDIARFYTAAKPLPSFLMYKEANHGFQY